MSTPGKLDDLHEHLSNTLISLRELMDNGNSAQTSRALLAAARLLTEAQAALLKLKQDRTSGKLIAVGAS